MTNPDIAKYDDMVDELLHLKRLNAELLAALKQCEDLLAELATGGAENPELATARAAIAKATGKE